MGQTYTLDKTLEEELCKLFRIEAHCHRFDLPQCYAPIATIPWLHGHVNPHSCSTTPGVGISSPFHASRGILMLNTASVGHFIPIG